MDNKILEKFKDKSFVEKLMELEKIEDVKNFFSTNNIELSENDINLVGNVLQKTMNEVEKLSEDELQKISAAGEHSIRSEVKKGVSYVGKNVPFIDKNYVDSHVEGLTDATMIGGTALLTLGGAKLISYGHKKGWWSHCGKVIVDAGLDVATRIIVLKLFGLLKSKD